MVEKSKAADINKESINFYKTSNKNIFNNNYHFQAPFGLINDPNGLSYFNGEYYIFFQWNPFGCEHKFKHWGLVKTKDFINYTIPKIVLEPNDYYDKNGCYSGSAIEKDGILEIIYTGNVKNEKNERSSYQCRGILLPNGNVKKMGPVLEHIPKGYTAHFRDPKVYFENGKYYFIIGAQTEELNGKVLLYSSLDIKNWKLEGEIKTSLEDFGYMWECPNLFKIKNKDILIFSPQGLKKEEFKYQNLYQSGYIIGNLNYNTLEFNHNNFLELDMGFDFYAPQVFQDNKDRTIMIGWMGVPEEYEKDHKSIKENWIHCLTMPRELSLRNNKIYQKPVDEMKWLRNNRYFKRENFQEKSLEFSDINRNSYEVLLDINKKEKSQIRIEIFKGSDEYFEFNMEGNIGYISRENMIGGPKGIRNFKVSKSTNLSINIFVDKSAVEIYINNGEEVLSSRVFAKENSLGLKIEGLNDELSINNIEIWTLRGLSYKE